MELRDFTRAEPADQPRQLPVSHFPRAFIFSHRSMHILEDPAQDRSIIEVRCMYRYQDSSHTSGLTAGAGPNIHAKTLAIGRPEIRAPDSMDIHHRHAKLRSSARNPAYSHANVHARPPHKLTLQTRSQ
jgi:hypothetical protein